jgi:hypothetical protein
MVFLNVLALLGTGGMSMDATVAVLSVRLGKTVRVSKELARNLVVVEPKGFGPKEVLDALAASQFASVSPVKGGFMIERTPADRARMSQHRTSARAKWMTDKLRRIEALRKEWGAGKSPGKAYFAVAAKLDEQWQQLRAGNRTGVDQMSPTYALPVHDLLADLILRIGPERLAQIPSGLAAAYTSDGSNGTQKLPVHEDLLVRYQDQMRRLQEFVPEDGQAKLAASNPAVDSTLKSWTIATPAAKLRLLVAGGLNGLALNLQAFDVSGRSIAQINLDAGPVDGHQTPAELIRNTERLGSPALVDLTDASAAAAEFDQKDQVIQGDLPQWFRQPDLQEPLNLFACEAMRALAGRAGDGPYILVLSDSLWSNARSCITGKRVNLDAFAQTIKQWSPYEQVQMGGWNVWRPLDTEWSEGSFADRKRLAKYVVDSERGGTNIRGLAKYFAQASSIPLGLSVTWNYRWQRARNAVLSGADPWVMAALGDISDSNWEFLNANVAMTVGQLGIGKPLQYWLSQDIRRIGEGAKGPSDWERTPAAVWAGSSLDRLPFTLQSGNARLLRNWSSTSKEPGFGGLIADVANSFNIPIQDVDRGGESPTVKISRAEFESRMQQNQLFRFADRVQADVRLALPDGSFVSARMFGAESSTSTVLRFFDLAPGLRDAIWIGANRRVLDPRYKHQIVFDDGKG